MNIQTVKISNGGYLVTTDTGAEIFVPDDASNRHYQEVQAWIAIPNTPQAEFTLQEVKDARKKEVNNLRDQKFLSGFTYNAYTYDATVESRSSLASYVANVNSGKGLPAGFTWRTVDNQDISFNSTTILDLHDAMTDWLNATFNNSWAHKSAIDALTTEADVDNYDISTGWPT